MNNIKRVHLQTLGCRLNEAELETWSRDFLNKGIQLTDRPDLADVLVVNTCAVTQEAVRKSRKLLSQTHQHNPQAKLVVSGCYASLEADSVSRIEGIDLIVPNEHKSELVDRVCAEIDPHAMPQAAIDASATGLLERGRHRAFIKVQDGCRHRCSFCIVTVARGEERSRPIKDILAEINLLRAQGINEVVLAGVHLGGYGSDIHLSLKDLINKVLAETDMPRIRLGSLEPWNLPDNFWALFDNPRLMPHLHLPLQSGSDAVLRRMSRRCKTVDYAELVRQARANIADFNLTSDIIVGFPGETDDEWRESLDFIEQTGFGHLHIFAYSPRYGTKAASMSGQLSRQIKRERSEALHQLAAKMKEDMLSSMIGKHQQVLIENQSEAGWHGYTQNYHKVILADTQPGMSLENNILSLRVDALNETKTSLLVTPDTQNTKNA